MRVGQGCQRRHAQRVSIPLDLDSTINGSFPSPMQLVANGFFAAKFPTHAPTKTGRTKGSPMEISNFKDMYLAELQELVSVERQLADALLGMAGAASRPVLKRVLVHHRAETEIQRDRLETILQKHGAN